MTVSGGIHHILSSNSHRSSAFHPTQPDGLVDTIKTAPRACPDWKVVSIGAKEQSVDDLCLERGAGQRVPWTAADLTVLKRRSEMMATFHIQTLRMMLRDEKGIILPGAPN